MIRFRSYIHVLFVCVLAYYPFCSQSQTLVSRYDSIYNQLPDRADDAYQKASVLRLDAVNKGIDSIVAKSDYLLGLASYYESRFLLAEKHFREAVNSQYALGNSNFSDRCWNNLGIAFDKQNRWSEARDAYFQSVRIAEHNGDSSSLMQSYINIYKLEGRYDDHNKAIAGFGHLLAYFNRQHDTAYIALCHLNLSSIYLEKWKRSEFEYHINEALRWCEYTGDQYGIISALLNKAEGLSRLEDYTASDEVIKNAVERCKSLPFEELKLVLKLSYASNKLRSGVGLDEAEKMLNEVSQSASEMGAEFIGLKLKEEQTIFYARTGRFAEFMESFGSVIREMEANNQQSARRLYEEVQALYENEKLRKEQARLFENVKEQRIWIITLALLLLVVVSAGMIIIRLFIRLRSRTRSLFYVNTELARSKPVVQETVTASETGEPDSEDDRISNLYEMILVRMEQNKPYLDPNFSLQALGQMMNRSERYVSQAINKMGKTNFNRLVVRYRINEARRLITLHGEAVTMNDVAEQSGFANRISFYRSFREETGLSPTEFLALSLRSGGVESGTEDE
jgi:YesN/AraC family two-component response regulator